SELVSLSVSASRLSDRFERVGGQARLTPGRARPRLISAPSPQRHALAHQIHRRPLFRPDAVAGELEEDVLEAWLLDLHRRHAAAEIRDELRDEFGAGRVLEMHLAARSPRRHAVPGLDVRAKLVVARDDD